MSGYFQRLVARAGGAVAPVSPLPPTLPSEPHAIDETDPFERTAGPDPAAERPDVGAPRPVRAEPTVPARDAAERIVTGVEPPVVPSPVASPRTTRTALAAPLPDESRVTDRRIASIGQPAMNESVSPGNPVATKPAGRPADQEPSREQESIAPRRPPAMLTPAVADRGEERMPTPNQQRMQAPEQRREQAPDRRMPAPDQQRMQAPDQQRTRAPDRQRMPAQDPQRMPAPDQQGHDAAHAPLSPATSAETRVIPIGTVERIVERVSERAFEPRDGFADRSPSEPSPSRAERPTPAQVAMLAPPPPAEEPAEARASDEPRLVIGRLQVDVMPPPAPAPAAVRVITRETPARQRTDGRASNLRFGLGQI